MEKIKVSVVVVSYNSSEFIIQTLDSIKRQTYSNLELIISDDCSKDDTVQKCNDWLRLNSQRFVRTQLVSPNENTGIPANCNRGIKTTQGEWIKIIAGDDMLPPQSIESLMKDVAIDKNIIVGGIQSFIAGNEGDVVISPKQKCNGYDFFFKWNAKRQYKYLLLHRPGFAAGAFIRRSLYDKIGYYDERYRYMEDLPFWIKATKAGVKIWKCDSVVALYRIHDSVSHAQDKTYVNQKYYDCIKKVDRECLMKNVPWYCLSFWESILLYHFRYWVLIHIFKNKRSLLGNLFSKATSCLRIERFFNPLEDYIYNKIYK